MYIYLQDHATETTEKSQVSPIGPCHTSREGAEYNNTRIRANIRFDSDRKETDAWRLVFVFQMGGAEASRVCTQELFSPTAPFKEG